MSAGHSHSMRRGAAGAAGEQSAHAGLPSVAYVNLGCRVNRVETDLIADELTRTGLAVSPEEEAQAVVINTCAVTAEAVAKARKAVRHAASLPQAPLVVATGCVANLFADELAALAPNVTVERDKSRVPAAVLEGLGAGALAVGDDGELLSGALVVSASTPTPTGRTRPGIKIQDGCDNRCTYCIVWKARGASRSVDAARVRELVLRSLERGASEVVLTGINLGVYRSQLPDGREVALPGLLAWLLETTPVGRIRLSSIEPPDVTDDLLSTMAAFNGRIAPFLHICLQSGCDATLKRMARAYDTAYFRSAVVRAHEFLPQASLGTDLIVGFPGETDEEFEQSLSFCREMGFSRMHVFRYSKRPGTPAATEEGQVDPHVMAERSARARNLAHELRTREAARLVGMDDFVCVQAPFRGVSGGLFDVTLDAEAPIDAVVPVHLTGVSPDGTTLLGHVCPQGEHAL